MNQWIRAPQIRLVDAAGEMLGVKTIQEALKLAEDSGYDLIEIAPSAVPPVCRLGNYSKFLYEKEKKAKEARKNRGGGQVKEVRMRPKIGEHDLVTKINQVVRFLKEHHKVRITIIFFGREMEHQEIVNKMLTRIEQDIQGVGVIEQQPQLYGNRLISIIVPHKG
ncbi:MAG: translation initiation factor IF-3 [Elusimicrobiota bacterium]